MVSIRVLGKIDFFRLIVIAAAPCRDCVEKAPPIIQKYRGKNIPRFFLPNWGAVRHSDVRPAAFVCSAPTTAGKTRFVPPYRPRPVVIAVWINRWVTLCLIGASSSAAPFAESASLFTGLRFIFCSALGRASFKPFSIQRTRRIPADEVLRCSAHFLHAAPPMVKPNDCPALGPADDTRCLPDCDTSRSCGVTRAFNSLLRPA